MIDVREALDRLGRGDGEVLREVGESWGLEALEPIREVLDTTDDLSDKLHCYSLLGRLGRATAAPEVGDALMARLSREASARFRLRALAEALFVVAPWDPTAAIAALSDPSRDMRHAAVQALGACARPAAELALIAIVEAGGDGDPTALRHAATGLARGGTARCADALTSLARRLPRDRLHEPTLAAALLGLSRLGRADLLPLVVGEMEGWRYGLAGWARMVYVARVGDRSHTDRVFARLTALVARRGRPDLGYIITFVPAEYADELSAGVALLRRVGDPRVDGFVARAWDTLFDAERERLAALGARPGAPPAG